MRFFKKLVGKKCYLSPVDTSAEAIEKYTQWLNDSEISIPLNNFTKVINNDKEKEFLNELLTKTPYTFAIVDIGNDNLIGNCGLFAVDNIHQTAEVGLFIGDKSCWNKGYGTEALSLLIDYGFNALNLHNIQLRVFSFNKRGIRSYEKIGFKEYGRRREDVFIAGKRHDTIFMDILASEFKSIYINDKFNEYYG